MQYYVESHAAGNVMEQEGEKLRYLSHRFILMGTKLGCATDYVADTVAENLPVIREFRALYKPFDFDYEVKYENSGSMQV